MKFVKPVEPIQIVKLVLMILLFASVSRITWVIHYKAADVSANLQETVHNPKNASDSNVYLSVEKASVARMPIAKHEITVLNVPVHLTSLEMGTPDVTRNARNMTTVQETRLV
jgi:hypothetical protein